MKSKWAETGVPGLWTDGDAGKLEENLTDIVVGFIVAGEAQYRANQVSHHAWLVKRRADNEAEVLKRRLEAERLEREKREREAKARRDKLLGQARDWRTAADIRSFVAEVAACRQGNPDDGSGFETWRAWALVEADAIDPAKRELEVWTGEDDG